MELLSNSPTPISSNDRLEGKAAQTSSKTMFSLLHYQAMQVVFFLLRFSRISSISLEPETMEVKGFFSYFFFCLHGI